MSHELGLRPLSTVTVGAAVVATLAALLVTGRVGAGTDSTTPAARPPAASGARDCSQAAERVAPARSPGRGGVMAPNLDEHLPGDTATEWVTYADHLAVLRVTGEEQVPPSPSEIEHGEGLAGRLVHLEVRDVLWSRPGAPLAPVAMTWSHGGWSFHDGRPHAAWHTSGTPWLLAGHDYLAPVVLVTYSQTDGPVSEWWPLSLGALLPYDCGRIGQGDIIFTASGGIYQGVSGGQTPLRDQVWGKDARTLVGILRRTPPDASAVPYMHLDPRTRAQEAARQR